MEFFEVANRQRAYRFLRPDPVPDELVEQLLDTATRAPSAQNSQPWEFVVVTDPEIRHQITDQTRHAWETVAREYSRPAVDTYQWAHTDAWAMGAFADAPVIIVVCGDTRAMDVGRLPSSIFPAVQNILLGALALGLGSLLSTLPVLSAPVIGPVLGLPDHLVALASIPIGWPVKPLGPPKRIPYVEKTHRDRYGKHWR